MKKIYIVGIALLVLLLGVSTVSAGFLDGLFGDSSQNVTDDFSKTEFTVYGYSPDSVESQLSYMEDDPEFYDNNQTRDWLKGLNGYVMLDTGHEYLVMERTEANKIPVIDDGNDWDTIKCNVIKCVVKETHPMGTGLKDLLLVKDVEVIGNKTIDLNSGDDSDNK